MEGLVAGSERGPMRRRFESGATVALFGASGFIGRAIARCLVLNGSRVLAVRRPESDWSRLGLGASMQSYIDIVETADLCANAQVDFAIDAAWRPASSALMEDDRNAVSADEMLARRQLCQSLGVRRWLGIGSCAEYDWSGTSPLKEGHSENPGSAYGRAKLDVCTEVFKSETREMTSYWLRPFFVYGPGDHPHRLIPSSITAFRAGAVPDIREPGSRLDFVHVDDLARIVVECVLGGGVSAVLNVGTGVATPVGSVVQWVGRSVDVDRFAGKKCWTWEGSGAPIVVQADCSKLLSWRGQGLSKITPNLVQAVVDAS